MTWTFKAFALKTQGRAVHPEWEAEQVSAEVQRIHAEIGQAGPDPLTAYVQ
ncbi:hypothetical protein ACIGXI_10110 [Kitasatospora aureofaciens]|uniref:hypothetical protein n=1 Tax=Kitasatospora aureofaciens TaxID=1894 RepID=UPI0037CAAA7D